MERLALASVVMKRSVFTLLFALGAVFGAKAMVESWLYGGFEYAWAREQSSVGGEIVEATMDSPGVNVSALTFWNDQDVGRYTHDSFLFPQWGSLILSGQTYAVDLSVFGKPES
jgi:alpha-glucosidase (family GH31 glycosyl hydrolase)